MKAPGEGAGEEGRKPGSMQSLLVLEDLLNALGSNMIKVLETGTKSKCSNGGQQVHQLTRVVWVRDHNEIRIC